jgi:hypothetical protein
MLFQQLMPTLLGTDHRIGPSYRHPDFQSTPITDIGLPELGAAPLDCVDLCEKVAVGPNAGDHVVCKRLRCNGDSTQKASNHATHFVIEYELLIRKSQKRTEYTRSV